MHDLVIEPYPGHTPTVLRFDPPTTINNQVVTMGSSRPAKSFNLVVGEPHFVSLAGAVSAYTDCNDKLLQITLAPDKMATDERRGFELSNYYARVYDPVAVEDLDARGSAELPGNSWNRASAAWGTFLRMLEYKYECEGTHFVAVNPRETEECASCGVSTDKPLWIREHSCPACGFEADRDANAVVKLRLTGSKREAFATAWNVLSRGIKKRSGEGRSESSPRNHSAILMCERELRSR